ncbi:hypothetical protein EOL70_03800 [Leucothrix sargassi]|nr:hypothetical protein EOL70_03800 [Leucothrix sargassi]
MTITTEKQKALVAILNQHLFYPTEKDWIDSDEMVQRSTQTRQHLEKATKDDPESLQWLALQEDFGDQTHVMCAYDAHEIVIELLSAQNNSEDYLLSIALNKQAEWYVRNNAITALNQKKSISHIKSLTSLLDFQFGEEGETSTVVETLFDTFVEHQIVDALEPIIELQKRNLTYLRNDEDAFCSMNNDVFTSARAGLGDETMLVKTIRHSFNDWYSVSERAKTALKLLLSMLSEERVFHLLHDQYTSEKHLDRYLELAQKAKWPLVRRWALDQYLTHELSEAQSTALITLLEDDWYVAKRVSDFIIDASHVNNETLLEHVRSNALSDKAKYWLIFSLTKRDADISAANSWVNELRITLPACISTQMRKTIVKKWSGSAQARSDIRWQIEAASLPSTETAETTGYDAVARVKQLIKLLEHHGISVESYVDYAEEMSQGDSTFYIIKMTADIRKEEFTEFAEREISTIGDWLLVSKLGPYIDYQRHQKTESFDEDNEWCGGSSFSLDEVRDEKTQGIYRQVTQELGYEWLREEQLFTKFTGLNIYFFGSREPLTVRDLLFYWQD